MKGLENEWERFKSMCVGDDASEQDIKTIKMTYMAGALAASARVINLIDSDLPLARKRGLLRRIARECEGYQQQCIREAGKSG